MSKVIFNISVIEKNNRLAVESFINKRWGSPVSVSRGKLYKPAELPGFICYSGENIIGLVTYAIVNDECEIVTLDSLIENSGLGTHLINKVLEIARKSNCRRIWLITTNDNTSAMRFYQKRGFEWNAFHKDAITESRKLKPEIPELGNDDIPIRHEIEFEYILDNL